MRPSRAMLMSLAFAITLGVSLAVPGAPEPAPAPRAKYDSPRLAALDADLAAGKPDALEKFWAEVKGKSPLVEADPENASRRRVTFLFRGDAKTQAVGLFGGMRDPAHNFKPLTRLGDTDLWFRTERVPSDARFQYNFVLDPPASFPRGTAAEAALRSKIRKDPLNSHSFLLQPIVELPDAPPQTWAKAVDGVPQGTLTEAKVPSRLLGREWSVDVYTPPGYDPKGDPLGLLVVFDGFAYRFGGVPNTLNNLLAKKRITPLVVVFVGHRDREKELACSETFADFLARELVPWVREHYQVTADPARTGVGGFSLGGLMAAYCAYRHPGVFGNVLSQSGSYWWYPGALEPDHETLADSPQGWLTREFVRSKRLPVRIFLAAGTLETGYPINLLESNRRFRDVLEAKGYVVTYSECASDHSLVNWRGSFADGLMALFGR